MHENEMCLKNSVRHYATHFHVDVRLHLIGLRFGYHFFTKVYSLLTLGTGLCRKKFPSSHFLGNPKEEKKAVNLFSLIERRE